MLLLSGKDSLSIDRILLLFKFNLLIPFNVTLSTRLSNTSWIPFLLRSKSSNTVIGSSEATGIFFRRLLCKFNLFRLCKNLKSRGFMSPILLYDKSKSSKLSIFVKRSGVISESSFCVNDILFRLGTSLNGSGQYVLIALFVNLSVSTWELGGNLKQTKLLKYFCKSP